MIMIMTVHILVSIASFELREKLNLKGMGNKYKFTFLPLVLKFTLSLQKVAIIIDN